MCLQIVFRFKIGLKFRNREHLSRENMMSISLKKEKTIKFIKFAGLQHDKLTGIMEEINSCYTFQVCTTICISTLTIIMKTWLQSTVFQLMYNIGCSFVYCILTFLVFYRYLIQRYETFEELSLVHLSVLIFFMTYVMTIIYYGNAVTTKVWLLWEISNEGFEQL